MKLKADYNIIVINSIQRKKNQHGSQQQSGFHAKFLLSQNISLPPIYASSGFFCLVAIHLNLLRILIICVVLNSEVSHAKPSYVYWNCIRQHHFFVGPMHLKRPNFQWNRHSLKAHLTRPILPIIVHL